MSTPKEQHDDLQAIVKQAFTKQTLLKITGKATKSFYGYSVPGKILDISNYCGIVNYEPSELVLTARAGTPLREIEATLETAGQMLAFEPPYYGENATLGGTIACGFSGPRRPYAGSARDFVLGIKCLNGKGESLTFGGQVMKNVAGYDVSRLMVGALGTLGVLLEISLKVLPKPAYETTLCFETSVAEAIQKMNQYAGKPLALSAACYWNGQLYIRLSGLKSGIIAAMRQLGGDELAQNASFWQALREHQLDFFQDQIPLWRLSLAPNTPPLDLPGQWLLDWGGAQRWLKCDSSVSQIRDTVAAVGGHATLFRHNSQTQTIFHPLPIPLAALHYRLKKAFDPKNILNQGQLHLNEPNNG